MVMIRRLALAALVLILILASALGPSLPADAAVCRTVAVNDQGTANAAITVDATAGGVAVLAANSMRCGAVIKNSGTAAMRCAPATVTVTSTVGFVVAASEALILSAEATQAWRCIRTTGSSTTADVAEAVQ